MLLIQQPFSDVFEHRLFLYFLLYVGIVLRLALLDLMAVTAVRSISSHSIQRTEEGLFFFSLSKGEKFARSPLADSFSYLAKILSDIHSYTNHW